MEYELTCECGKRVSVNAGAAGSRVPCDCGRTVEVPSLRELRRQRGEVVTANPVMVIERLLAARELPIGLSCSCCHREEAHTVNFVAECERRWIRRPGRWDWLAIALFSWPIALLNYMWERQSGETRESGRDIILTLPVRLCEACRAEMLSPADYEDALYTVPIYAQLLNHYPQAKLTLLSEKSP